MKLNLPIVECEEIIYQFTEYVKFYKDEPHRTLAVENVGSRVLHEDDEIVIVYETKIDWICSVNNIPLLPVDHKTSKRRTETISLSNQFIGYCWMLGCTSIMINKVGFQKTLKSEERFQRVLLSYNPDVIEEWRVNAADWVKMLYYHQKTNHWTRNYTSCDKWGGCIFRPICESERSVRDWKAKQLFSIREPWDVGKVLK